MASAFVYIYMLPLYIYICHPPLFLLHKHAVTCRCAWLGFICMLPLYVNAIHHCFASWTCRCAIYHDHGFIWMLPIHIYAVHHDFLLHEHTVHINIYCLPWLFFKYMLSSMALLHIYATHSSYICCQTLLLFHIDDIQSCVPILICLLTYHYDWDISFDGPLLLTRL